MVEKVAGKRCRSAQKAKITVVRVSEGLVDGNFYAGWPTQIDGFWRIYDNIRKKQPNGKAVINTFLIFIARNGTKSSIAERLFVRAFTGLLKELAKLEVILVVAAGNKGVVSKASVPATVHHSH